MTGNKFGVFVAGVVAIIVLGGVAYVFPSASNQGYAPEQPIPFSHRVHAGENKIDCKYCHFAADKSRHAGIPPLNVCMNCHSVVKLDSPHIQKLRKAYEEGRPIEWVRIHELPDFVFFNHKRHVQKGVSCETCHGDVKTMDKVVQAKSLEMGWCMKCHRGETTPSKVLSEIRKEQNDPNFRTHKMPVEGHGEDLVAPINCSTCHY